MTREDERHEEKLKLLYGVQSTINESETSISLGDLRFCGEVWPRCPGNRRMDGARDLVLVNNNRGLGGNLTFNLPSNLHR